jgi:hypothetical protein
MRASTWRVVSLLALALSSGLIVGCGTTNTGTSGEAGGASSTTARDDSSSTEAPDRSRPVPATNTGTSGEGRGASSTRARDGSSSTGATDGSRPVPAVAEMGVFSRPRAESDVLPRGFAFRLEPAPCTEWHRSHFGCEGEAVGDRSRLLFSGLGARAWSLYAWPTTNGWVCWAFDQGGGGCTPHFESGVNGASFLGVGPDRPGVGAPGSVIGLVSDDVVAVDVTVRGVPHPATLRNNGLFYELPDGDCSMAAFDSLTVTFRDGTSDTIPIEWHAGGEGSPGPCEA